MDVAFADAVRIGTDAVHSADPNALAAIEGGQIPGGGGWDYSRLAKAVDVMEVYDDSGNVDILRSLNPAMVLLTTSFESGTAEEHRVWREMLRGTRGLILWDEKREFVREDLTIGGRGREAMAYLEEIRSGLGAQLIETSRHYDAVAILYSPASLRIQWLLDWRGKRESWSRLDPDAAYQDSRRRAFGLRYSLRAAEHTGLEPRILTPEMIENGALDHGTRVLILPHAIALSSTESRAIREFVRRGGIVLADTEPGLFDEHGQRMDRPALSELFAASSSQTAGGESPGLLGVIDWPIHEPASLDHLRFDRVALQSLRRILGAAGVEPTDAVTLLDGTVPTDVVRYGFTDGDVAILGLQRDLAETGSDGGDGQPPKAETVVLTLPQPAWIYDLRKKRGLGRTDRVVLNLDAVGPTVLALAPHAISAPRIAGAEHLRLGETAEFRFEIPDDSDRAVHILHLEIVDPTGKAIAAYTANLRAPGGRASQLIPIALNDPVGRWYLRVTDVLSGESATASFTVSSE
jgi:hypothetical protein